MHTPSSADWHTADIHRPDFLRSGQFGRLRLPRWSVQSKPSGLVMPWTWRPLPTCDVADLMVIFEQLRVWHI